MSIRNLRHSACLFAAVLLAACKAPRGRSAATVPVDLGPIPLIATTQPTSANLRGASLTVVPSDARPLPGHPVTLSITLANALVDPLWLPLRHQDAKNFVIFATDAKGAQAPLTPFGAAIYSHPPIDPFGIVVVDVPKDHPRRATLKLNDIYNLSKPGKYTITARVYVFQRGKRDILIPLTSPPITIDVP